MCVDKYDGMVSLKLELSQGTWTVEFMDLTEKYERWVIIKFTSKGEPTSAKSFKSREGGWKVYEDPWKCPETKYARGLVQVGMGKPRQFRDAVKDNAEE